MQNRTFLLVARRKNDINSPHKRVHLFAEFSYLVNIYIWKTLFFVLQQLFKYWQSFSKPFSYSDFFFIDIAQQCKSFCHVRIFMS